MRAASSKVGLGPTCAGGVSTDGATTSTSDSKTLTPESPAADSCAMTTVSMHPRGANAVPSYDRRDPLASYRSRTTGRFQICERIGDGGMGVIYRATDLALGRQVALKALYERAGASPGATLRCEARAAGAVNDPRVATVYGVRRVNGIPVIVMELVEGESVAALLRRGALPVDRAIGLCVSVCGAVASIHRAGLVHLDLKPENIAVTRNGSVKVLDFGIAASASTSARATRFVHGTRRYMSPERLSGAAPAFGMDIYAVGVILLECLVGTRRARCLLGDPGAVGTGVPRAENVPLDIDALKRDLASVVDRVRVGTALARVIATCLAADPRDRFCDVRELGRILCRISTRRTEAEPPSPRRRAPARPR